MRILNTDQAQARPLHYMRVGQLHSYKNLARDLSSCLTLRSSSTGTASHSLLIGKRGQPATSEEMSALNGVLSPTAAQAEAANAAPTHTAAHDSIDHPIMKQCLPTRVARRIAHLHQKPIFTTMENSSKRRRFLNYISVCCTKNLRLINETPLYRPRISERVASWCIVT